MLNGMTSCVLLQSSSSADAVPEVKEAAERALSKLLKLESRA
jgi:hypothetical protein